MKLSPHEQQILDEIQRAVQAEDPEFAASMAGRQVHGRPLAGSATFLVGMVALVFGAILAQAMPWVGVCMSVAGFLAMFGGVWLFGSGGPALHPHGRNGAVRRRIVRFWGSLHDPPPGGMSA